MARAPELSSSRRLLARLRDIMAGSGSVQERLDQTVSVIARDIVAEVCSIYLLRAGEVLELFASEGLKPSAIHHTRLAVGEGLVGLIAAQARPVALADAQSHPAFAYRPETGEEIYQSLMGVPILRGGRVLGVVVVQNRTQRQYTDEEIETLETVAMVLAELIVGSHLISRDERHAVDIGTLTPTTLRGVRLNGGLAIGEAVRHEPYLPVMQLVADSPDAELARLRRAVADMHGALDEMLESGDVADDGEHREVLEAYRMFAEDRGWIARITEAIRTGLTAEAAVKMVQSDTQARFRNQRDPYLRERLHDFDDLANRLLQHLIGKDLPAEDEDLPENIVVVARNMGPAELLDYDRTRLRALVLEEGSATTHVAIVARALDIPVVGRVADLFDNVERFDPIIVDGDGARVFIRPTDETRQTYTEALEARARRMQTYAEMRDLPAETVEGVRVSLNINAGLISDLHTLTEVGAEGIGLYRTEVPFMERSEFPDVDRQAELYERIFDQSGGKPVVFRTLDIGGDKRLPYWGDATDEENPAMGWRAIRVGLDRPTILRHQIRALIKSAHGRELSVMFPMITEVAEFDSARHLLDRELEIAERMGRPLPSKLRVGTMVEVPALAFQMDALLERTDFVSIGSNDLFQFLFASDRGSPRIADRYDPLAPAAIEFLRNLVTRCDAAGVPISLCGEMAGRPLDAMALIGIGFRNLSMAPSAIGPVKTMIRSLSVVALGRYLETIEGTAEHSLREKLRQFALDHGVII